MGQSPCFGKLLSGLQSPGDELLTDRPHLCQGTFVGSGKLM